MTTLADRLNWVVHKERLFPSLRKWALATNDRVAPSTLNDLVNKPDANPGKDTIEALSLATERDGKRVSAAWLMFGYGSPYDADVELDPVYPSRTFVLMALVHAGHPTSVIERLRQAGGYRTDPGEAHWYRKAAEFIEDANRSDQPTRVTGG